MKVVTSSTEPAAKFGELAQGDVFRNVNGNVFMKTRPAATVDAYKNPLNAVNLETGFLEGFLLHSEKVVHLKNARLVLGDQEEK